MQLTFFSFVMSLIWFNLYIILINFLRKKDNFIISFNTFPLIFFLFLSMFRLIFNFEWSSVKKKDRLNVINLYSVK